MIDVEPICRQFKQYLEIDNRCILSAKFGDGKSYFLSKFTQMFSDENICLSLYIRLTIKSWKMAKSLN